MSTGIETLIDQKKDDRKKHKSTLRSRIDVTRLSRKKGPHTSRKLVKKKLDNNRTT